MNGAMMTDLNSHFYDSEQTTKQKTLCTVAQLYSMYRQGLKNAEEVEHGIQRRMVTMDGSVCEFTLKRGAYHGLYRKFNRTTLELALFDENQIVARQIYRVDKKGKFTEVNREG